MTSRWMRLSRKKVFTIREGFVSGWLFSGLAIYSGNKKVYNTNIEETKGW